MKLYQEIAKKSKRRMAYHYSYDAQSNDGHPVFTDKG